MALNNPLLGQIPQPEPNTNEVYNPLFIRSNYGAQVITPLINTLFATTLTTLDTQTSNYDTTSKIVLTQMVIQGLFSGGGAAATGTVDITLNGVTIFSIDLATQAGTDTPFSYNIPLENVLIENNSRFSLISVNNNAATSNLYINVSIIGYYNPKL